jgi:hypothetical protein
MRFLYVSKITTHIVQGLTVSEKKRVLKVLCNHARLFLYENAKRIKHKAATGLREV